MRGMVMKVVKILHLLLCKSEHDFQRAFLLSSSGMHQIVLGLKSPSC